MTDIIICSNILNTSQDLIWTTVVCVYKTFFIIISHNATDVMRFISILGHHIITAGLIRESLLIVIRKYYMYIGGTRGKIRLRVMVFIGARDIGTFWRLQTTPAASKGIRVNMIFLENYNTVFWWDVKPRIIIAGVYTVQYYNIRCTHCDTPTARGVVVYAPAHLLPILRALSWRALRVSERETALKISCFQSAVCTHRGRRLYEYRKKEKSFETQPSAYALFLHRGAYTTYMQIVFCTRIFSAGPAARFMVPIRIKYIHCCRYVRCSHSVAPPPPFGSVSAFKTYLYVINI